jgi:peptide/nickel transport system permease protein
MSTTITAPPALDSTIEVTGGIGTGRTPRARRRGRFTFWLAVGWLVVLGFHAVLADFIPYVKPWNDGSVLEGLLTPRGEYWFGTDANGFDIFARTIYGARFSMMLGALATLFGLTGGAVLGLISGYFGGWVDRVIDTSMSVILAFPALIFALMFVTFGTNPDGTDRTIDVFGSGFTLSREVLVVGALSILAIPALTRLVRANTLVYKEREFVLAAKSLGAGSRRILTREILPNIVPTLLSFALTALAILIVAEAGLGQLGLSIRQPRPTWGGMINDGRNPLINGEWWVALAPGAVMFLTVLAINLLGDVLSQKFNVREAVG